MKELLKKIETIKGIRKDFKKIGIFYWEFKRQHMVASYMNKNPIRKLHIGSNISMRIDGWLCSDIVPVSKASIYLDATKPFPLMDETFDYVYSEHMIEHISQKEGEHMLRECFRILKKGGRIRLATPDIQKILDLYYKESIGYGKEYLHWISDQFINGAQTYSAIVVINAMFRNWSHSFLYDEQLLVSAMENAGFKDIKRCRLGESDDSHLRGIEQHHINVANKKMVEFETMILEGQK